jgi:formylmethanofuran dehydrogenase subunit C
MMTLTYRGATSIPIEAECITPNNLASLTPSQASRLPVQHGNASVRLGEFFDVRGDATDREIVLEGDCSRVKCIGMDMTGGRITLHGNAGMHLGAYLHGGHIIVHGNAGDWLGAHMRGGRIEVRGHAGDLVGAGYRGSRSGMRGGVILVHGNAGNEVGSVLRRGLIAIGGSCGDFAGISLLAGSIFLFGPCGSRPGAGMKRGTLVLLGSTPALLPSFRYSSTYEPMPVFLSLYLRQLREWGFPGAEQRWEGSWRRYCGDLVSLGKGEIFVRQ